MTRKTSMFDVFAGLLFFALFLAILAGVQVLKSGQRPKLAPPDPSPSIVERSN